MLNGRPALIVEEEFLIALDIQRMLESMGAGQTLFARNADEARQLDAHWNDLALAIVELRMDDHMSQQLCADLVAAGLALVVTTGDIGLHRQVSEDAPLLMKPIPEEALASAVQQALAARS